MSPAAPKRPRGRPPNQPAPTPEDDIAADLRTIVGQGRDALRERMEELCDLPASETVTAEICTIMKELSTVMNAVRRLDEASTRKIPPFRIVRALKEMTGDERANILEQFGVGEGAAKGSVLG